MVLKPKGRPSSRIASRAGEFSDVVRYGETHLPWKDIYHHLLKISWPGFIGLMGLVYLAINALFALAYLLGGEGAIANTRPGSFTDLFFFSVQTLASIGYGAMYPQTLYAHGLVVIEAFIGLLFIAITTGISFARFSLPSARILFSNYAVIAPQNGVPTLMFRTANKRRNRILEAQLWVTLVRDEITAEGEFFRRFYDLKLSRSHTPLFALSWTAMHPIEASSPLYGETAESLAEANGEIVVILTGIDETISQTIHARHSFLAQEIFWNYRLRDIFCWTKDGRRAIDYSSFDLVEPIAPAPASPTDADSDLPHPTAGIERG
ncbi:ion channel [Pseudanabaena sp. FACHB-2040]|uniref:ion channel n=1 Tax=Pseudanabaena sp. FACHB-2040 TaxID=2692859 RepID=UPI001682AD87|nr:ion channel [Pseudanabaena sp. FACHB-2040]MBD2257526.1 ATP-sensitive inward rectifier potassium channel 10 [Pseudanabaena sp. FACHB-2040]